MSKLKAFRFKGKPKRNLHLGKIGNNCIALTKTELAKATKRFKKNIKEIK